MSTKEFIKAWEELSAIQQEAAKWDKGPLLVLVGPDWGKTRVLTCPIARILDFSRDMNFRILGLTFTNKAADEIRSRLTNFVPGQEGRLSLELSIHSCGCITPHGTHLNINPNFSIYSQENDLQAVLDKAVEEGKEK